MAANATRAGADVGELITPLIKSRPVEAGRLIRADGARRDAQAGHLAPTIAHAGRECTGESIAADTESGDEETGEIRAARSCQLSRNPLNRCELPMLNP